MSSCSSHSHVEKPNPPSQPLPTISVDGISIDETDLANELQYHQYPNFDQVVQNAGQALVIRQVLKNYALKQGMEVTSDNEEAVLQKIMANQVVTKEPTESDCLTYFNNNQKRFSTQPLLEVDHILLAAAKDDLPSREVAKNNAKEIIEKLKQDPCLFPALAQEYSACPSKKTGGSLGQLSKGQTVPEFERQLENLPQGLASKPIESRYGFHVVNVTRRIDGKPLEYSMVSDKVRNYLSHRASHLGIQAFIQGIVEKADIKGIELRFAEDNIVV